MLVGRGVGVEHDGPERRDLVRHHRVAQVHDAVRAADRQQVVGQPAKPLDVDRLLGAGLEPREVLREVELGRTLARIHTRREPRAHGVHVIASVVLVDDLPEDHVAERRCRLEAHGRVAAARGQGGAGLQGTLALHRAEREIGDRIDRRGIGPCGAAPRRGQQHEREHRCREERIEHGDHAPGHAHVRERPQELRAVRRAGIEQAVAPVAQEAEEIGPREREPRPDDPVQQRRAQQRPHGHERERVREVAVILHEDERVARRVDQRVEVRRHAGHGAQQARIPQVAPSAARLCPARAERGLAHGVHLQFPYGRICTTITATRGDDPCGSSPPSSGSPRCSR